MAREKDMFDKARDQTQRIQSKAQDNLDNAREKMEKARKMMQDTKQKVEDYVVENPIQSVLIAAGVGLVIGTLWSASMRR